MFRKLLNLTDRRNKTQTGGAWSRLPSEYRDGPRELQQGLRLSGRSIDPRFY